MWLVMMGGPGTCKKAVASALVKDEGYIVEGVDLPAFEKESIFEDQFSLLLKRWKLQRFIQREAKEKDIIQVRTFWDTHEVYSNVLHEREHISLSQFKLLDETYRTIGEVLEPPNVVLHFKNSKIQSKNRMTLSGGKALHDEDADLINKHYETLVDKIRVTVIDIDASDQFDQIMQQVRTELNAIRTAALMGGTIWQKTFLKGG